MEKLNIKKGDTIFKIDSKGNLSKLFVKNFIKGYIRVSDDNLLKTDLTKKASLWDKSQYFAWSEDLEKRYEKEQLILEIHSILQNIDFNNNSIEELRLLLKIIK